MQLAASSAWPPILCAICNRTMLSVAPLTAPVFHEPGLDFRSLNITRGPATHLALLRDFFKGGRALRRFVAEHRIDTVLAFWYDWASVTALALPRSVKKVGCEHMSFFEATPKMRLIRAKTYRRLDAVVSLTEEDLPHLAQISRAVHVIPNYVPAVPTTPFEQREKILLTIEVDPGNWTGG
jgi:hypothetical protein